MLLTSLTVHFIVTDAKMLVTISAHQTFAIVFTIIVLVLCSSLPVTESVILTPPYFNLAEGRKITASATCGVDTQGPELYCKLVGANAEHDSNVIQGQVCDYCDPTRYDKMHPPEFAVDGMETWWQSPPLSRGMKYNEVNLTIDLGQEFHVAYVYIRMGNSPRPGLWVLEKSSDHGKSYTPWQYFSDSPSDCETYFGRESLQSITKDDSVICNTEYSKIVPLEGGEIPISLLKNRPSANHYFNSSVLQEWTRATNVRFRLLRTKNLLGHLMSVARQDPTVTRRYFYSIKDISIGGRCMCNGHADTCDIQDPSDPSKLMCRCQHNTCGPQCATCCPGFEQKAWRQSKSSRRFVCEPCNCHNHATECIYDPEVDARGGSLDIHGNYEGGGVCQNCEDNTEGVNCDRCKPTYYRPYGKQWNETDVCRECPCNYFYSTGNCEEETGKCECRKEFQPPNCDSCSYGYFGFPNCKPCECHLNGTNGYHCEATNGYCPCKPNYSGNYCTNCAEGYYGFPDCLSCECNTEGSLNADVCDYATGQCTCKNNFDGRSCDKCRNGFYNYPKCEYCNCDIQGTLESVCNETTGKCLCRVGYGGERCDQCSPGYYGYPNCRPCSCSQTGSSSTFCDATGKCPCLVNYSGRTCEQCSPGYYKYPECLSCNCDSYGAIGITCNTEGQCQCKHNFGNTRCDICKEGFYNFPNCEDCNCDPAGVVTEFAGCGSVPAGELCKCKTRVHGRICDKCRPLYWNLNPNNVDGCEECGCHFSGTASGIAVCDDRTGQCNCKPSVGSRTCNECADGFYRLDRDSVFGCEACNCDVGGSINSRCNKRTGQCDCHPRITGRTCTEPLQTHYFPTLYQHLYEVEDGYTVANTKVRYSYDQRIFPDFSWKGYAVFSQLQNEIIQDVYILKSSVYRVVLRYVNPNSFNIAGTITVTPDNPSDNEQTFEVLFKSTREPAFVTVSGAKGNRPSPFVMNPGNWYVHIKADKSLFVDYFILLPAAFYEASILTQKVDMPCKIGQKSLCRHFRYPEVNHFDVVQGIGAFVENGDSREPLRQYFQDQEHLDSLQLERVPVLGTNQMKMNLDLTVAKPGSYVLVVDYVTLRSNPTMADVKTEVSTKNGREHGSLYLPACIYSMLCRQVILNRHGNVAHFNFDDNFVSIILDSGNSTTAGIKSISAIPFEEWSLDYIQPKSVCVLNNGKCTQTKFTLPPDSKKIEFESGNEDLITAENPFDITDNETKLIYLDHDNPMIDIKSNVSYPGYYTFVVQYYQPGYPAFDLEVLIQNGQFYEAKLPLPHCPSNAGCRSIVIQNNDNKFFDLTENFVMSIKVPKDKDIWLDYLLLVPREQYTNSLLVEDIFDQTKEFISVCGHEHFHINTTTEGFCKDAVFSLTADYNNRALPCQCDFQGSLSFECEKFGGQCECKPNIIGRKCEECKTGFYGFPDCKPCNCPTTAICEPKTGACICPPRVTGAKCDQCERFTYGFDPIIGCEDCKCDPLGIALGHQQCDIFNGSCTCKENVVGRTCDRCQNGYHGFPYCESCECDIKGTLIDICDQVSAECFCKSNVYGEACDVCKEGTFNIQEDNPEGCTKCFCFGKTTRCDSTLWYSTQVENMSDWHLTSVSQKPRMVNFTKSEFTSESLSESVIGVDLANDDFNSTITYFSAPKDYLGNKLTSYGGVLNYTIFYTTGLYGSAISGADVILQGNGVTLLHESLEQPAANIYYKASLDVIESNFMVSTGVQCTREQLMIVLENLQGLHIRAPYWSSSVTTRLQNVSLDTATDVYYRNAVPALAVEECQCPPNYAGLSCEDCAPGYYRSNTGPHGGYCVPCQCNGHSETCDVNTGKCFDCEHATTGDHCELCITGYHGNATFGTPNDCLICACPLPISSNNFAVGCEVSPDGNRISCECSEGYYGARCESCAAGYFGRPESPGEVCSSCSCSGNIDADEPGSCDSITGECLKCLNNTSGVACNLCAPGYFGDAVLLKDCQSCICDRMGTEYCDSFNGTCKCYDNVEGEKCERCIENHYGFNSGRGCTPCDCAEASEFDQCEDTTGQCSCKSGVTGRKCDRCAPGFWNLTESGCVSCNCKSEYSVGLGCNANTGQCECLPGVIGEKCDRCPHRWVLIPNNGCFECDSCSHDLLDVTDSLYDIIEPVAQDFKSIASDYFLIQKLEYITKTVGELEKKVETLDPEGVELSPIKLEIEGLDQDINNLNRQAQYNAENGRDLGPSGTNLRSSASDIISAIRHAIMMAHTTVSEVDQLANSLESGQDRKVDSSLTEGKRLLEDIQSYNFTDLHKDVTAQLEKAEILLEEMVDYAKPAENQSMQLDSIREQIELYNNKLDHIYNNSLRAQQLSEIAENLTDVNYDKNSNSKLETVKNQTKELHDNLELSQLFLTNSSNILMATQLIQSELENKGYEVEDINNQFNKSPEQNMKLELDKLVVPVQESHHHANDLHSYAETLDDMLADTRNTSHNAVQAATAYKTIIDEIDSAREYVLVSQEAATNASDMVEGLADRAGKTEFIALELLQNSRQALDAVQLNLTSQLKAAEATVDNIQSLNEQSENIVNEVDDALDRISTEPLEDIAKKAADDSRAADEKAKEGLGILSPIISQLPEEVISAKQVAKTFDDTNKDVIRTRKQLEDVEEVIPKIERLAQEVDRDQSDLKDSFTKIADQIDTIKDQLSDARELANSIKVGVKFQPNTTLELKPPANLPLLTTSTRLSGYFKTENPNGFLMYLGNEKEDEQKRAEGDDFMAVEIDNGYPVLVIDVGNGPERIINDKYVSDGEWHEFIVERTGKNVKLSIRDELEDGQEQVHDKEEILSGPYSMFNVDQDNSHLFVGGFPNSFQIDNNVRYSSFEGEIEDLMIGDTPVGLWNFVDGQDNYNGALQRDKLIDLAKSETGYRFNKHGYVFIDAAPYSIERQAEIRFDFNTNKETTNGLLFLSGNPESFIIIEMRNGRIYYKYRLDRETVTLGTKQTYNDGEWHTVIAGRDGRKGRLKLDNSEVITGEDLSGSIDMLHDAESIYFGGHPRKHNISNVTNLGFDGCIDKVQITGTPVDLSSNINAVGVKPGCPSKFERIVSFDKHTAGYIRRPNISAANMFQINLKFKTYYSDGLIFYASNHDQSATVSLSLVQGRLLFRSQKEELSTKDNTYSDGQWHVVTVTHEPNSLRLDIDDTRQHSSDHPPQLLHMMYGDLWIGGLPNGYNIATGASATREPFIGCIGDATLNGVIINFANSTDKVGEILGSCTLDKVTPVIGPRIPHFDERPTYPEAATIRPQTGLEEEVTQKQPAFVTTMKSHHVEAPATEEPSYHTTHEDFKENEIWQEPSTEKPHSKPSTPKPTLVDSTPLKVPDIQKSEQCKLPVEPVLDANYESGYRFGTTTNSRLQFDSLPGKYKNKFEFSVDFRTAIGNGIIFYAADSRHVDFVALYMMDGKLYYTFNCGSGPAQLSASEQLHDGLWHTVVFSRQQTTGKLIIDGSEVASGDSVGNTKTLNMEAPFYLGGIDPDYAKQVRNNLMDMNDTFDGCLRNFKLNDIPVGNTFKSTGVIPCSDSVEPGMFMSGGYLKIRDRFRVGSDFNIKMDIKPRTNNGLLVSVHGKRHYLILQMINGTINFTVDSGKGPMVTTFVPPYPHYFCNGNWHSVEAVKVKYLLSLVVDSVVVEPHIDSLAPISTETSRPLLIGGHPHFAKVRGVTARAPFIGCIRNLEINRMEISLATKQAFGKVQGSVCPTN